MNWLNVTTRSLANLRLVKDVCPIVEFLNRTVRYDWLGHYLFESIAEVQEHVTRWIWAYNHERPNMALGGITLKQKLARAA